MEAFAHINNNDLKWLTTEEKIYIEAIFIGKVCNNMEEMEKESLIL